MQRSHLTFAWLIALALTGSSCGSSSTPAPPSTTLPEFTTVITAGPELEGAPAAFDRALALAEASEVNGAVATFSDLIAAYDSAGDLETRRVVADAYFNKALSQVASGAAEDAVATYALVATSIADDRDLQITETTALGLLNRGDLLIELGRFEDAEVVFNDLLNRFGARIEAEIVFTIVGAGLGKGDALVNLGRIGEAVFIYDAVVVEAGIRDEPAFEAMQVAALVSKGRALARVGAADEAVAALNFVLDAWTWDPEPQIVQLVGLAYDARNEVATTLGAPGEPGSCLILEEKNCALRDRFPERQGVEVPFLSHVVAFDVSPGTPLYVPYNGELVGPDFADGTEDEVVITFGVPATDESPENRCTVQFIPDGAVSVNPGPAVAGALIGTIADARLSAPATTGFVYNLTLSCLFRDPVDDDRFAPDLALIDRLFGPLPG